MSKIFSLDSSDPKYITISQDIYATSYPESNSTRVPFSLLRTGRVGMSHGGGMAYPINIHLLKYIN